MPWPSPSPPPKPRQQQLSMIESASKQKEQWRGAAQAASEGGGLAPATPAAPCRLSVATTFLSLKRSQAATVVCVPPLAAGQQQAPVVEATRGRQPQKARPSAHRGTTVSRLPLAPPHSDLSRTRAPHSSTQGCRLAPHQGGAALTAGGGGGLHAAGCRLRQASLARLQVQQAAAWQGGCRHSALPRRRQHVHHPQPTPATLSSSPAASQWPPRSQGFWRAVIAQHAVRSRLPARSYARGKPTHNASRGGRTRALIDLPFIGPAPNPSPTVQHHTRDKRQQGSHMRPSHLARSQPQTPAPCAPLPKKRTTVSAPVETSRTRSVQAVLWTAGTTAPTLLRACHAQHARRACVCTS